MVFHGTQHGTTRFVAVGTVIEFAVGGEFEYLGEVMGDFSTFHLDRPEAFNTRRVDQITAVGQRDHFGESRRMHSLVMIFGDIAGTEVDARH